MTSPAPARLVLRHDPAKAAPLSSRKPLTIGRAGTNLLSMPSSDGVAEHHAVVRWSRGQGWVVCDWGSGEGTYLEGQRIRQCRRLSDGDEIRLGQRGPVLVFQLLQAAGPAQPAPTRPVAAKTAGGMLDFAGQSIPMQQIDSVQLRSRPRHPASFSWWALLCLGGLVLLPWRWAFWPLQLAALAGWIVLGSRKDHVLVVTLRNGMAYRHTFTSKITALAHRNGIRKAIGQPLSA